MGVFGFRICSVVIAMASAMSFAAPVQAATVVGSPLTASDTGTDSCTINGDCTQWNDALPGATLTTPAGVVTAFTVRSSVAISARIRILRGPTTATTIVASTSFASIPGTNSAETVDTRLSVNAGDVVALGLASANDFPFALNGGATGRCFSPSLLEPGDGTTQASVGCSGGRELLYNATVEADADSDEYGDESQDACPTNPGPSACPVPDPAPAQPAAPPPASPPAPPDAKVPVLSSLSVSHDVFRVNKSAQAAVRASPRGTAFRFSLSEAATVTIAIEQQFAGRRVSGRCQKVTSNNRKRNRCVRYVRLRSFKRSAKAGDNAVSFGGRIRVGGVARALRPARYRAGVTAHDAAGNVSAKRQVAFRVVR